MRLLVRVVVDRVFSLLLIIGLLCVANVCLTGTLTVDRVAEYTGAVLLTTAAGIWLGYRRSRRRAVYRQVPKLRVAFIDDDGNLNWRELDGQEESDRRGVQADGADALGNSHAG